MTKAQFYIYAHCRPSGEPFYIGKGIGKRAWQLKRDHNKYFNNIINKYGRENILIFTLNCDSEQQAFEQEAWMIAWCRAQGFKIANNTDGGEGTSGYKYTHEQRVARAKRMQGNTNGSTWTSERREAQSEILRGNKRSAGGTRPHTQTPEWKMAQSKLAQAGWTPDRRAAQANRMTGNKRAIGNGNAKGNFWITDGSESSMLKEDRQIPFGWHKGRTIKRKEQANVLHNS